MGYLRRELQWYNDPDQHSDRPLTVGCNPVFRFVDFRFTVHSAVGYAFVARIFAAASAFGGQHGKEACEESDQLGLQAKTFLTKSRDSIQYYLVLVIER
jgi:hypothetical protein